jgi:site-specific recombinase XerC
MALGIADGMAEHLQAWEAHQRQVGLTTGTIRARRYLVQSWGRWIGDGWRDAGWRDVEAWIASKDLKPRGKNVAASHLRAFYRWCRREGSLDIDPCRDVELPKIPRRLPRPASERDLRRAIGAGLDRCELACAFMAYGGLRCCEVAILEWGDVNLVARRLHVIGKGDKEAYVPIVAPLAAIVAQADGRRGRIVTSPTGQALTSTRVSQVVNAHLRRVGADCTAHQLRHYAGTRMLELEGDLLVVRDFLRHASVSQTECYAQLAGGRLAAAAAKW